MSHVFPRHTRNLPPKAVRGEGCYLYDESGKQYLDGSGGAAVSCLGHGDAEVIEAIKEQLEAGIPMGRYAEPSDIARIMLFLASDDSEFMTGSVYMADGGYTA